VAYLLRYHPAVAAEDLPDIPRNLQKRVARAIETRLTDAPDRYGVPLRGSLKGYWKLRVGDYRVVFKVVAGEVWILTILHRKAVYEQVASRASWRPPAP
jgi:mRNA interferase RelE/StbE